MADRAKIDTRAGVFHLPFCVTIFPKIGNILEQTDSVQVPQQSESRKDCLGKLCDCLIFMFTEEVRKSFQERIIMENLNVLGIYHV